MQQDQGSSQVGWMVLAGTMGLVLFVVVLVVLFGGQAQACEQPGADQQPSPSKAANSIPGNYLTLYKKAGRDYGIPWNVLAGIGKVETGHGTSKLPGVHSGENAYGAGGPMQFLQGTWNQFGVDGDPQDDRKDRYDPVDAIPAAANYLKHNHGDEGGEKLRKAIWFYNHAWDYVNLVLDWAKKYAAGDFQVGGDNKPNPEPCLPGAGGPNGRPDGAGAKSPVTGTTMTGTMRKAMLEIDSKFGPFPTIGCTRPGDPQDHGVGQACDFMETMTGRMPSASALAHGDSVAAYAIANGKRLGIKYVIWKQHIWNITLGDRKWRKMENRGSITQNHFDHIHVSVVS